MAHRLAMSRRSIGSATNIPSGHDAGTAPVLLRRRSDRLDRRDGSAGLARNRHRSLYAAADGGAKAPLRRCPRHRARRCEPQRKSGLDGRTSRRSVRLAQGARRGDLPLQGLFDFRFEPGDRQHRPRHRHRPAHLGQARIPLLVGAPQLRRYTAFGNLFADYQGQTYRIDRHPVMSRHPVTPMDEADLRLHLAKQTAKTIGLIDLAMLCEPDVDRRVDRAFSDDSEIVLFDVGDSETQKSAGRQIWRTRNPSGSFVVGSSGVEYALLAEWARQGTIVGEANFAAPGRVERIAVVSGSCSPTTERQIRHAMANGFDGLELDPRELASGERAPIANATERGLDRLKAGRSVILYTALGPSSDIGGEFDQNAGARHAIGRALGQIERALIEQASLSRALVAGGDTSSHALRKLGVYALTTRLPLPETPGSPLCLAHSEDRAIDGLELAFKGGQVGGDDYFSVIRDGGM